MIAMVFMVVSTFQYPALLHMLSCYRLRYAVTPDARQLPGLTVPIHPQPSSPIATKEREAPAG
jgi:hypothetical protein